MAKTVVSGGGGGSNGEAVSFMDDLVAEAKARTPPEGAFTATEFMGYPGVTMKRGAALDFLGEKVDAGNLLTGKFPSKNGTAWYFWPAPNPKAKRP